MVGPTDILIIGAGGAGLRAATAAKELDPGLRVLVMSAGNPRHDSVTSHAASDRMMFHVAFDHTPPGGEYAWKEHAKDIYIGGGMVSSKVLAEHLASNGSAAFAYLDRLGVPWVRRADGKPAQILTDGSIYPRACYTGPHTAKDIHNALYDNAVGLGVEFLQDRKLLGFKRSERGGGFWVALWDGNSEIIMGAGAVILASGGPGAMFGSPLYPEHNGAIPLYSALRAGARLVNLEFIQFGAVSPSTGLACSGSIPRAMPKMVDGNGEELRPDDDFPGGWDRFLELMFRKGVSWTVSAESLVLPVDLAMCRASESGGVFLDFRENPSGLDEKKYREIISTAWDDLSPMEYAPTPYQRLAMENPLVVEWFTQRGFNLEKSLLEIKYYPQHFQGGVLINRDAEAGVPGLFACGECAGGQHGATRPGGNSLLDGQVMGATAGRSAARFATSMKHARRGHPPSIDELDAAMGVRFGGVGIGSPIIVELTRQALSTGLSVFREDERLSRAIRRIDESISLGIAWDDEEVYDSTAAWAGLIVARCFLSTAWLRRESRGSHVVVSKCKPRTILPLDERLTGIWFTASLDPDGDIVLEKNPVP